MENYEWKRGYASIIIAVFFIISFIAALTCVDGMAGGYAIAFVSFFIAFWGIAVAALSVHRARVMDAILNNNQLLAHWTYPAEIARDSAQREYREFLERNRAMFILIGGVLVVVSLVFIIFVEDGGLITGTFLLAFTVVLFIIARITPKLELKRALKAPHEAYIARNGIILRRGRASLPLVYDNEGWCLVAKNDYKKSPGARFFLHPACGALCHPAICYCGSYTIWRGGCSPWYRSGTGRRGAGRTRVNGTLTPGKKSVKKYWLKLLH